MNRPYRKLGRPKLQEIAKENWDSPHVLKKIAHELSLRDSSVERKDVREFYEGVLRRLNELEGMTKTRPEDGELRLRLQKIEQLRVQAENTGVFEWFKWPTTFAPIGDGTLDASGWHEKGLFSSVGYHVGKDGEHPRIRHRILDCIFDYELPKVNSEEYMSEFGIPESSQRLDKMANFLAAGARNFSRHSADYSRTIDDYKGDLKYLYDKYYVGVFHFDQHPSNASYFEWPQI